MTSILVVDDDHNICQLLELYLLNEGYQLYMVHDGSSALDVLRTEKTDLVILDIMLPVINGWEVCKMIRQISSVPIIMLTACDLMEDKIQGFELGVDDYIVKPFEPRELVARVKARLKNVQGYETKDRADQQAETNVLNIGNIQVDMNRYEARLEGEKIELKPKEIQLLYFLLKNRNMVFTRDQLLEKVWGYSYEGDTRTVDVHINKLREKLEGVYSNCRISTVWGVGYKLEIDG
ncbi:MULTISPECIES: response regulator transcription factor [Dehalobacter]|uniref:Stage 0 sporulation protein A homolog n=2 Tax=Dehalobacter restrictus TaxID=55583 RepID=A0A857DLW9_9FIRM|nr:MULTISPECIES: response regulator transcription factor [Dehalobacter]AHF10953.1 PhoP family transcriptional regulator [Dehalobacter restrictus DSM 9455]MDJ0307100.1 response regulator transcription factor [Dehalobacter sp.]OCZ49637.1 DNA-binding response regulator [Dehalobacter sp. TeCB1]QHA01598.1 response regulator [Dehalobacter restrictus]